MASAVANRYAHALVDIVMAPGSPLKPEDALAQLSAVEGLLQESPELRTALETPAIQTSRKRAVMARPAGENRRFTSDPKFRLCSDRSSPHRQLSDIREAFELQLDERLGFVRAEVSSAAPLTAPMSASLEAELSKLTGKRMRLRFEVDPALLGGVVARIGSTVYDGSVRGELRELGKKLAGHFSE